MKIFVLNFTNLQFGFWWYSVDFAVSSRSCQPVLHNKINPALPSPVFRESQFVLKDNKKAGSGLHNSRFSRNMFTSATNESQSMQTLQNMKNLDVLLKNGSFLTVWHLSPQTVVVVSLQFELASLQICLTQSGLIIPSLIGWGKVRETHLKDAGRRRVSQSTGCWKTGSITQRLQ